MVASHTGQRLAGKTALVTAAGQGIGRASALAMANEGARVFATDINADTLASLAEVGHENIEVFEMDATDTASVNQGVGKASPDILFNCAGFVHHGTILDATDEEWDFAFDLNVRSMFRTIRAALPGMLERGAGELINFASMAGWVPLAHFGAYNASKFAVVAFTEVLELENAGRGVRFACVCPPPVATPLLDQATSKPKALDITAHLTPEQVLDAIERDLITYDIPMACSVEDEEPEPEPTACDDGCVIDCAGDCTLESWIGDGYCEDGTTSWGGDFDCFEFDYDGGDCL